MAEVHFVYIMFMGKAHPQKWHGHHINSINGKVVIPAYSQKLSVDEERLTLKQLCEKYPFPYENAERKYKLEDKNEKSCSI